MTIPKYEPIIIEGCDTIAKLFWHRVQQLGDKVAMREKNFGIWEPFTWTDYGNKAREIGMGLLAVMSVPLMRWAVCILGAVAGAILTSGIWYAAGLNEQYIWAGGMVGLVGGGMISFIVFRVAVILFASMWGSGLMIVGTLALLYLYQGTSAQVETIVFTKKWFLPTMLTVTTVVGIILQHKFVKGSKEWNL